MFLKQKGKRLGQKYKIVLNPSLYIFIYSMQISIYSPLIHVWQ